MPITKRKAPNILIIEDEDNFKGFLETILKRKYNYLSTSSWSEAESLLYEKNIPVVLLDLRLPGISGRKIFKAINREFKNKPKIIIITGYENDWNRKDALADGVFNYFKKGDFSPNDLIDTIDDCFPLKDNLIISDYDNNNDVSGWILRRLYYFTNELISLDSLNDVIDYIIRMIKDVTGCLRISVMLLSDDGKYLYIKKAIGLKEEIIRSTRIKVGENIAGKAFNDGKVILSNAEKGFNQNSFNYKENGPFMSIPLIEVPYKKGKKPIGVINLTNKVGRESFTAIEKNFLFYIANAASIAIKNELRKESLEKSYLDTFILLANVLEARDKYTQGHSDRVAIYASEIAKRLSFNEEEISGIRYAGKLHDIGKIKIPDSILLKKGTLTEEEYDIMKSHPIISKKIVDHLSFLSPIKGIFLHHHERYDGKGYPDGIKGEEIEVGARILAVADAFDAMTSNRPYRNTMPISKAAFILKSERGKQFDPQCVDAFISYLNEQNEKF